MASVASRRPAIAGASARVRPVALPAALLLGVSALSLWLRTLTLGKAFWMDEALTLGIATEPFGDIPGALRGDGSPPLYYALLHVWASAFGDGMAATQALSLVFAMLAIPAGLWAGWSLFGRRAGLITAAFAALNPYLTLYADETRMYALMVLLSILATAAFVHAFVYRRRGYVPAFAVLLAAMLYTHNWGFFFGAGCTVAVLACLLLSDEQRPLLRDALLGFGGTALLYAPWLPTLLYQSAHTAAPWLNPPRLGTPVQIGKDLLGGSGATVALLLAGGSGVATLFRRRPRPRERTAVIALLLIPVGTLVVGWVFSHISPAWTTRYLGVILGPLFLLGALGLSRAGRLGIIALCIVLAFWAIPRTFDPKNKSNAKDLARDVKRQLHPGDLVVVTQPEQTPLLRYQIGPGPTYASVLGRHPNPSVMDWRDGMKRMRASRPATQLEPLLARVPRGGKVVLVRPAPSKSDDWDAPWTRLVRRRSAQWFAALERDPRFRRTAVVPYAFRLSTRIGVHGAVYTRVS
jgi:mannosyltransferase